MRYVSTKIIPMGSTAFRQWRADSHCKLIHGYRLQTKIYFTSDSLDERNWVFDFGGCKEIKNLLEKQFDHTTCVAGDDPELETFQLLSERGMIDLRIMEEGVGIEKTAEWVYNTVSGYVKESTDGRVHVTKVEVWEHEGNSAIYEESLGEITFTDTVVDKRVQDVEQAHDQSLKENQTNLEVKEEKPPVHENTLYGKKTTGGMSDPFAGTSWGNS